jgi:hypothetical protein
MIYEAMPRDNVIVLVPLQFRPELARTSVASASFGIGRNGHKLLFGITFLSKVQTRAVFNKATAVFCDEADTEASQLETGLLDLARQEMHRRSRRASSERGAFGGVACHFRGYSRSLLLRSGAPGKTKERTFPDGPFTSKTLRAE